MGHFAYDHWLGISSYRPLSYRLRNLVISNQNNNNKELHLFRYIAWSCKLPLGIIGVKTIKKMLN